MPVLEQLSLVVIYAGIVQGLFVAFLLNSRAVRRSRANVFLSVLLIALSFSIAHTVFGGRVITHLSVRVYSIGDPTFLLIAPLIWFYVLELTGKRVGRNWRTLLHFLPFLLVITFSLTLGALGIKKATAFVINGHLNSGVMFWTMVLVQFSCYQLFIHKRWIRSREMMQHEVSNMEDVNISWVRFFMGVFLLVNAFFLFSLFASIHLQGGEWLWRAVALTFSLSIFALGYKGILQKEIFDTRHQAVQEPAGHNVSPPAPKDESLIRQVTNFMEERKPYLDPELTLSLLARELSMSRTQLSHLINDGIGDNFYDFVNRYRVEEVKRLMADPRFNNYNVLGLALEAGFKSKSTFNLIFKRFTGLTPTKYRIGIIQDGQDKQD